MSNLGLEHALGKLEIPFERAKVGDRYVMELLHKNGWQLGGENSGHVICLDRVTTGDAIVASLNVLSVMKQTGASLADLRSGMTLYPQYLVNVPIKEKVDLNGITQISDAVERAEKELGDAGRILLRPSGTEPLVRVMVEGQVANDVENICNEVARAVGDALD